MAKAKFTLEQGMEELDDILYQLEGSELSLSQSMALYKKGVKLLEKCHQVLDKTEKEIIILQEGQNERIPEEDDTKEDR
ncbi:MAG: exodeoxyribonuclease VII small subunit [Eubacteriales bacterium]|nr:exodeoxyribonuclease VII small subunit [Eubacteriales bacterium]